MATRNRGRKKGYLSSLPVKMRGIGATVSRNELEYCSRGSIKGTWFNTNSGGTNILGLIECLSVWIVLRAGIVLGSGSDNECYLRKGHGT